MKEKLTVVKVGGAVVEDEAQLAQLLKDFSAIEGRKVLVHGGGRRATQVAAKLGIESKMIGGRRITDADMLSVVTMVYGGLVNKTLVTGLQAHGVNALGLTGADMNVIRSHKRPLRNGIDFGFVGDVDSVDGAVLADFIEHKQYYPTRQMLSVDEGMSLLFGDINTGASLTEDLTTWMCNVLTHIARRLMKSSTLFSKNHYSGRIRLSIVFVNLFTKIFSIATFQHYDACSHNSYSRHPFLSMENLQKAFRSWAY